MSEHDGQRHGEIAFDVVEVAVADARRDDADEHFSRTRRFEIDVFDDERLPYLIEDRGAHGGGPPSRK